MTQQCRNWCSLNTEFDSKAQSGCIEIPGRRPFEQMQPYCSPLAANTKLYQRTQKYVGSTESPDVHSFSGSSYCSLCYPACNLHEPSRRLPHASTVGHSQIAWMPSSKYRTNASHQAFSFTCLETAALQEQARDRGVYRHPGQLRDDV